MKDKEKQKLYQNDFFIFVPKTRKIKTITLELICKHVRVWEGEHKSKIHPKDLILFQTLIETQKLTIINELTQKERTNYTTIGNDFSIGNDLRHQAREIKFLGKKTSEPGIPDNELDMEQVTETVIDALTNNIQFLKDLSSNFYKIFNFA